MNLVLLLICAPLLLWALHDLVRRPILRRQAVRNLIRRPGETVIVLAGALLGTAIITASFIVGDTVDSSIRDIARTELGPVDEAVRVTDAAHLPTVADIMTQTPIPDTDGVVVMQRGSATAATTGATEDRRGVPRVNVYEVDFDEARAFGEDPAATGLHEAGPTPRDGHVAVGASVARQLDVGAGDTIDLFIYGRQERVQVDVVLPRIGLAGRGEETVFVAPGSLQTWFEGSRVEIARPPVGEVLVSNVGGVFDGADATDSVMATLIERRNAIQAAHPDIELEVSDWKADLLADADEEGSELTTIFSSIGAFAVIAGILLVVNIIVMLAEERRNQLGVLRSLGLKRNQVIRVFGLEGTFYAVAASVLGAVAGVGVGYVVAVFARTLLESDGLILEFAMDPSSLLTGGLIGLAVTLATVWGASIPLASLNVISAIRDLPAPRSAKRNTRRYIWAAITMAVGAGLTLLGVGGSAIPALVGPAIVLFGAIPIAARIIGIRLAATAGGLAAATWGLAVFRILPETMRDPDIAVFVFQGVVLVAGTVLALTVNSSVWQRLLRGVASGTSGVPIRLGLTYPLARPGRTGMLLGMYSLVIFTIMFMGVFSAVFSSQADDLARESSAGFDVVVDTNRTNPATPDQVASIDGVEAVAALTRAGVDVERSIGSGGDVVVFTRPVTGVDEAFFARGGPTLEEFAPEFDSARAVFDAVLARDDVALAGPFLFGDDGPDGGRLTVGTELTIVDSATATRRTVTVIGVVTNDFVWNGLVVNNTLAGEVLGERAIPARLYVAAEAGVTGEALAAALNGGLLEQGADARSFVADIESEIAIQNGFIRILQGYLGLGLAIGVAGLGIVLVRAVRERRREIGMLRAMGYQSSTVRRAFVVEALFIAGQGAVVGVGLGIVSGWQVVTNANAFGTGDPGFTIPVGTTLLILVGPLLASLLAAAGPARRAAAIRPAVALRVTG